jgi:hypothetical protein
MSAKNVALATALGWTMRVVEDGYFRGSFSLHDPSGKLIRHGRGNNNTRILRFTEDDAWSFAIEQRLIPDYATDIAAVLAALDATGRDWKLYNYDNSVFNTHHECWHDGYTARGAMPAEAVFAALCAYYGVGAEVNYLDAPSVRIAKLSKEAMDEQTADGDGKGGNDGQS